MTKIVIILVLTFLSLNGNANYPDVLLINETQFEVSEAIVRYNNMQCSSDRIGRIRPGQEWRGRNRGLCLISEISVRFKDGSNAITYRSEGTSYGVFIIKSWQDRSKIFSKQALKAIEAKKQADASKLHKKPQSGYRHNKYTETGHPP
jgi:hypothetical protein